MFSKESYFLLKRRVHKFLTYFDSNLTSSLIKISPSIISHNDARKIVFLRFPTTAKGEAVAKTFDSQEVR